MHRYDLTLRLLTEDSGNHAYRVLEALVKPMLRLVEPACQTHRVEFQPISDEAREGMHTTHWKSGDAKHERHRIALRREIAATLLQREREGFVLFHVDGDVPWSRREESENARKFDAVIRAKVHVMVEGMLAQAAPPPASSRREEARRRREQRTAALEHAQQSTQQGASIAPASALLERLIPVIPYYTLESWLYQNTRVAIRLSEQHYRGQDVPRIRNWEKDRSSLDELMNPKDNVCLGSRHNLELATERWPAADVYRAGASFNAAVEALRGCEPLREALSKTAEPPV